MSRGRSEHKKRKYGLHATEHGKGGPVEHERERLLYTVCASAWVPVEVLKALHRIEGSCRHYVHVAVLMVGCMTMSGNVVCDEWKCGIYIRG